MIKFRGDLLVTSALSFYEVLLSFFYFYKIISFLKNVAINLKIINEFSFPLMQFHICEYLFLLIMLSSLPHIHL